MMRPFSGQLSPSIKIAKFAIPYIEYTKREERENGKL